jgi:hypothetical protein
MSNDRLPYFSHIHTRISVVYTKAFVDSILVMMLTRYLERKFFDAQLRELCLCICVLVAEIAPGLLTTKSKTGGMHSDWPSVPWRLIHVCFLLRFEFKLSTIHGIELRD